jgi:hypothetical protein
MMSFKRLLMVFLGLATLAATVGCGDKDDDSAEEATAE